MPRKARITRKTKETDITVDLNIDGSGVYRNATGIPFLDHMLDLLSKHSLIDLKVRAKGDLNVDYHHTVEDVGLVIGQALDKALAQRAGITRYGSALLPMDEAMSRVAIDLGGRPFLVYSLATRTRKIRDFDVQLIEEFFRAFSTAGRMNLHIAQLYGKDVHHAVESVFKGVARALRQACAKDPRVKGVPSSKGSL
ncbi:MAG: imidazoleglycerol-phosphate dehydratase HisB [Verrucomicrobia bacterium]|nr:imidazoleglycerol-phosphate dehydratase HisB [Verrucomicrobiota bacterium]MDA1086940.1 imidazoleglycerol-phosphate dehydratase HisB [Verrucomicrobiota bacterium]